MINYTLNYTNNCIFLELFDNGKLICTNLNFEEQSLDYYIKDNQLFIGTTVYDIIDYNDDVLIFKDTNEGEIHFLNYKSQKQNLTFKTKNFEKKDFEQTLVRGFWEIEIVSPKIDKVFNDKFYFHTDSSFLSWTTNEGYGVSSSFWDVYQNEALCLLKIGDLLSLHIFVNEIINQGNQIKGKTVIKGQLYDLQLSRKIALPNKDFIHLQNKLSKNWQLVSDLSTLGVKPRAIPKKMTIAHEKHFNMTFHDDSNWSANWELDPSGKIILLRDKDYGKNILQIESFEQDTLTVITNIKNFGIKKLQFVSTN